jgi:hypothetical protein
MLQQITPRSGRPLTKFTPANIQKIKDWVAQGMGREEIAKSIDVTVGTLQVTCSRLGISLRRRDNAPRGRVERRAFVSNGNESLILERNFSWSCRAKATSKRLILLSPLATLGGSELKR